MQKISKEKEKQIVKCLKMGLSMNRTAKATSVGINTVQRVRNNYMPTQDQIKKNKPNIPKSVLDDWDRLHARYGRKESNVKD